MAIFSTSLRTFSRSRGDSATAAAAYRAGITLADDRLGKVHDYSRRGGVERVRILVPKSAPSWARDAARLWNAVEAAEARSNSRVARELIVALPHELDAASRASLAEDIGRVLVDRYGAAAMVAIHAPDGNGDQRNHHAHILFSTRSLGPSGFGSKVRVLDDRKKGPKEVELLRQTVADLTNSRLAAAGVAERVDHRTLSVQARAAEDRGDYEKAAGLTREPTSHVGRAGTALARSGGHDERITLNGARAVSNQAALATYFSAASRASDGPPQVSKGPPIGQGRRSVRCARGSTATVLGGSVRGARATGKDAGLLNAQAAVWEEGVRVDREAAQAYLDGLRRAMEHHAGVVDAYLAAIGRPSERPRLLEQCARDPAWVERLRRSLAARAELRTLGEELPRRRRQYGQAMVATAEAQRALDEVEVARPSAWRPLTRRQWAEKRRAERARLERFQSEERTARSMAAGSGADALKEQVRKVREEIRGIERDRRAVSRPQPAQRPIVTNALAAHRSPRKTLTPSPR